MPYTSIFPLLGRLANQVQQQGPLEAVDSHAAGLAKDFDLEQPKKRFESLHVLFLRLVC